MNSSTRGFDNYLAESESSYVPQRSVISLFVNTGDLSKKLFVCCDKEEITKNVCKLIANIYYETFVSKGLGDDSDEQLDDSYYGKIENKYIKVEHLEFNGFILPAQQKIGELLENKAVVSAKMVLLNHGAKHESKAKSVVKESKAKKSPAKTVKPMKEFDIDLLPDEILPPAKPLKSSNSNGKKTLPANKQVDDILESIVKKVKLNDEEEGEKIEISHSTHSNARTSQRDSTPAPFDQPKRKRGRPPKDESPQNGAHIEINVSPAKKPDPMNAPQILSNKKGNGKKVSTESSPLFAPKTNKTSQKKTKANNIDNDPTQILPTLDMSDFVPVPKISIDHSKPQPQKSQKPANQKPSNPVYEGSPELPQIKHQLSAQKAQSAQKGNVKINIQKGENGVGPGITKRKSTYDLDSSSSGSSVLIPSNKPKQANKGKQEKKGKGKMVKKGTGITSATSSDMELEKDLKKMDTKKSHKNANLF